MLQIVEGVLVALLSIVIGFVLLTGGRRYYPIFVGVGGLALVQSIFGVISTEDTPLWVWLVSIAVGGISAYLAPRFEDISLRVAGFVLGGYVAVFLISTNGYRELHGVYEAVLFFIGAGLGLVAIRYKRDEWIITLSSLAGAALVTNVLGGAPALRAAAFSGLAAAGMLFQAREWILPAIPERHRTTSGVEGGDSAG